MQLLDFRIDKVGLRHVFRGGVMRKPLMHSYEQRNRFVTSFPDRACRGRL